MFLCVCSYSCGTVPELNGTCSSVCAAIILYLWHSSWAEWQMFLSVCCYCIIRIRIRTVLSYLSIVPELNATCSSVCAAMYYTCGTVPELSDSYVPLCVQLLYLWHSSWTECRICSSVCALCSYYACATVPELNATYVPLCVQQLYLCHSSWTEWLICSSVCAAIIPVPQFLNICSSVCSSVCSNTGGQVCEMVPREVCQPTCPTTSR